MKATLALLTNRKIENRVNHLAWQIHRRWNTGLQPRCLPAHISLKQPFEIGEDLNALEGYLAKFSTDVAPFPIHLGEFYVWETVFGVQVQETYPLHDLHDRLNRELPARFGDISAPFDGDAYRFHLTIATGGAIPEVYQEIYATHGDGAFPTVFTAREVAAFVYAESRPGAWEYMVYTVLPLMGRIGPVNAL